MRIFFDVDHTILNSSGDDWVLRPGTAEVMAALKAMGHDLYMWSATGLPHCERVIGRYGLTPFITEAFEKSPSPPIFPEIIIDDDDYLVGMYSGVWVSAYRDPDPADRELFRALETVRVWTQAMNSARVGG